MIIKASEMFGTAINALSDVALHGGDPVRVEAARELWHIGHEVQGMEGSQIDVTEPAAVAPAPMPSGVDSGGSSS